MEGLDRLICDFQGGFRVADHPGTTTFLIPTPKGVYRDLAFQAACNSLVANYEWSKLPIGKEGVLGRGSMRIEGHNCRRIGRAPMMGAGAPFPAAPCSKQILLPL